ncbi:VWA domain-containing protein [Hahella sp. KA22]|uniref:VWA domain-containing protein n=1 Tax=Hahella sp. KA22 TaxID=1628392 RepID=UPI000FDEC425|nr:VWA domain-containing protein [Hahella sp. KA22]AZZ94505.1 VWA domain-containing protein [Hahella sp. KA22]QAY57878.1 VWA domain-containing protein [Hahella sp. KA22]
MNKTPARPNAPPASRQAIQHFLQKVKTTPLADSPGSGRFIFAVDATMSRQRLWDQASQLQTEMFLSAGDVKGLQVQFVYYRGFREFNCSDWVSDANALVRAMTSVYCMAGQTQIGRVLAHGKAESLKRRVQALVFVGDALEEDAPGLLRQAGELGIIGAPVFMFQEGYDAGVESVYRDIARLSGGAWCRFDEGSAEQLKELLGAVAEYARGGLPALDVYSRRGGPRLLELRRQLPGPKIDTKTP